MKLHPLVHSFYLLLSLFACIGAPLTCLSQSAPAEPSQFDRVTAMFRQRMEALDRVQLAFHYTKTVIDEKELRANDEILFVYDMTKDLSRWEVNAKSPSDSYSRGANTCIWDGKLYTVIVIPEPKYFAVTKPAAIISDDNGGMGAFFTRWFGFKISGASALNFGELKGKLKEEIQSVDGTSCLYLSVRGNQIWLDEKTGMLKRYQLDDIAGMPFERVNVDEYSTIGDVLVPLKTTVTIFDEGKASGTITLKLLPDKCVLGKKVGDDTFVPHIPAGITVRDDRRPRPKE